MQVYKPLILDYYIFEEKHNTFYQKQYETFRLNCTVCKTPVKASLRVTSNWVSHFKNFHQQEYAEYLKKKESKGIRRKIKVSQNHLITNNIRIINKYPKQHPTQIRIEKSMLNLVINSSLPLSIIDSCYFRQFMHELNPQYNSCSRKRLTNILIPKMYDKAINDLEKELSNATTVAVTADAWSDPCMKAYFAITAHLITQDWIPKAYLLDCKRLCGSHTADYLRECYDNIINRYNIQSKTTHLVTDNAANMRKAFNKTSIATKKTMSTISEILNTNSNIFDDNTSTGL